MAASCGWTRWHAVAMDRTRSFRTRAGLALVVLAGSLAIVGGWGCGGGGDDLADIRATATAAASAAAVTPTIDPMAAYKSRANGLASDLSGLYGALFADLLKAQVNQADPKWPGVLTGDADLIVQKAQELRNLAQPAELNPVLAGKIGGVADAFSAAATLLKQAVLRADPGQSAQAVQMLGQANNDLEALRTEFK